jgi:hypothetical protein
MRMSSKPQNRESPEQRVGRLVARLRHHALWDSLLIFSPPLLVAIYFVAYGYRAGWIAPLTLLLLGAAIVGGGFFAVVARCRALIPSMDSAARLVDERTDAKDRFLTLATIEVSPQLWSLAARLRGEAAALLERIDFRREFPYRIKRSFCWSLSGSLLAAAIFYLSMPLAESTLRQAPPYENLRELAEKMAQRPGLSATAQELQTLAMKLPQPSVPEPEKRNLIQQALERVENQQEKEKEKENQDLLGEASSALQALEEQSGRRQKESPQAGGSESGVAEEESGKGQKNQGNDGAKGERSAERGNDPQKGKTARGDSKEQGKEKSSQAEGEKRGEQPDPNKSDKGSGAEVTGKTRGGREEKPGQEKLGRSRSEEPPRDAPPAERFYKPGEQGKGGVKGTGYVTVQLPEEVAVEAKGEGTIANPAKETKTYPKVPVSNTPLPAHVPDAPAEKQQLPLEYRGIIR